MKRVLIEQGVVADDVIEEVSSHSTHENAVECAPQLRKRGIAKILLVTDGMHMERALRCFQKQGVSVVGCGCNYRTSDLQWTPQAFIPGTSAVQEVRAAIQEYAALTWYAVRRRI
jgi:uncharacterized SAM-binding protein YcdF (DUF218 family)